MGRIDAIIGDELESQFRVEIAKRLGGKKGDLQIAVEEAIKLWINSDVMQKLKEKAMKKNTTTTERVDIVNTIKTGGKPALKYLGDLLSIEGLSTTELKAINEAIRQIQV
jgi:hypothetical protein